MAIAFNCCIEFDKEIPTQTSYPRQFFNKFEEEIIDREICKLLDMRVIEETVPSENQFVSPIFTRPKKDGEYRMILNLKELNESIEYHHFKMDTFETALKLIKPNCFMASIDLRHAYYSVNIYKPYRKYLRFHWKGKLYEYTCLPNGIALAPRKFTKLMKPVYANLRQMGHSNVGYIDDSMLSADTKLECSKNVDDTVSLMSDLGFIVHDVKSVIEPVQNIVFLGNHIDSIDMIVYLTESRKQVLLQECRHLRGRQIVKIREVARLVGLIVASFSAVEYGPLFYRELEKEKSKALVLNKGNFDAKMSMTFPMLKEIDWWIENLPSAQRKISHGIPEIVITTDASGSGWGARCDGVCINGRWTSFESVHHINYLELLAVFYALKSFCKNMSNKHIQIRTDNTCALSYIKNFGGIKSIDCNDLAKKLWSWAMSKQIWVTATYVPGSLNEADYDSRNHNDNIEWMLDSKVVETILGLWDMPKIDMFASRLNKQMQRFVSWKPDPEAEFVDAFAMTWSDIYFYAFPPFSLVPRLMVKLREEKSECILIAPIWMTQPWFTTVMEHLVQDPYILPVHKHLLMLPGTRKTHPLHENLTLMVCRLSGILSKASAYQKGLRVSLCAPGDIVLRSSTRSILENGLSTVVKGRLVTFKRLLMMC